MATILETLMETINEEIKIYEDLLAIGKEKKNIIINNEVEVLKQMNTVEISLANKLKKLEEKRKESFDDIKMVLGLSGHITLTKITEKLKNEKEKKELINLKEKLKTTAEELRKINEINRNLINNSLDYIGFSMNLIRQFNMEDAGTYSKEDLQQK